MIKLSYIILVMEISMASYKNQYSDNFTMDSLGSMLRDEDFLDRFSDSIAITKYIMKGKVDKGGDPLYAHAIRMAASALLFSYGDDAVMVALFHDLIEDGDDPEAVGKMIKRGYGSVVYDAVMILTRKEDQTYMDYIRSIKDSGNDLAIKIKLLDLNDHTYWKDNIKESLYNRYVKAIKVLHADTD